MSAATVFTVEKANLFLGDEDPTKSQHLVLQNVKLPVLGEKTKDFSPGGGVLAIKLGMLQMDAFEVPFQLQGFNPDAVTKFMPGAPRRIKYTIRAAVRDLREHTTVALKAIVEGRMVRAEVGQFGGESGTESDYSITEITFYHLFWNDVSKYKVDFFAGPAGVEIDGVQPYRATAAALGIL